MLKRRVLDENPAAYVQLEERARDMAAFPFINSVMGGSPVDAYFDKYAGALLHTFSRPEAADAGVLVSEIIAGVEAALDSKSKGGAVRTASL